MSAPARTFTARHVQLLRALFAAAAALMITFSADHSAPVGLAVFSGFVGTTALVLVLAAWLVFPAGSRWSYVLMAALGIAAMLASGVPSWRNDTVFFVVVIIWAAASGLVELIAGLRARGTDTNARDAITVGAITMLLAVVLLLVRVDYSLKYSIEGAGEFTLTGIILGVGIFGAYAAIIAVFLAIAGFTPRRFDARASAESESAAEEAASVETGGNA